MSEEKAEEASKKQLPLQLTHFQTLSHFFHLPSSKPLEPRKEPSQFFTADLSFLHDQMVLRKKCRFQYYSPTQTAFTDHGIGVVAPIPPIPRQIHQLPVINHRSNNKDPSPSHLGRNSPRPPQRENSTPPPQIPHKRSTCSPMQVIPDERSIEIRTRSASRHSKSRVEIEVPITRFITISDPVTRKYAPLLEIKGYPTEEPVQHFGDPDKRRTLSEDCLKKEFLSAFTMISCIHLNTEPDRTLEYLDDAPATSFLLGIPHNDNEKSQVTLKQSKFHLNKPARLSFRPLSIHRPILTPPHMKLQAVLVETRETLFKLFSSTERGLNRIANLGTEKDEGLWGGKFSPSKNFDRREIYSRLYKLSIEEILSAQEYVSTILHLSPIHEIEFDSFQTEISSIIQKSEL